MHATKTSKKDDNSSKTMPKAFTQTASQKCAQPQMPSAWSPSSVGHPGQLFRVSEYRYEARNDGRAPITACSTQGMHEEQQEGARALPDKSQTRRTMVAANERTEGRPQTTGLPPVYTN
ncbi:hypothetical protein MRX96_006883 [Rhipicephalus microplus]